MAPETEAMTSLDTNQKEGRKKEDRSGGRASKRTSEEKKKKLKRSKH